MLRKGLTLARWLCFLSAVFALLASSASRVGDANTPLHFAVIGDTGTGEEPQYAISRRMLVEREKAQFDFVLMLGDNIYGGGDPKYFKPRFEDPYKELLAAGVRFYAALGNHDAPHAEAHTKYDKFNMGGKRYYTFKKEGDLIEFFVLDTNETKTSELGREQYIWLENELKSSKAKWKVVYFHHSIYSSGRMHSPYMQLRRQVEPLFVANGVNVVFGGHYHVYERIKPQKGIQYFTVGSSGKLMKGNLDRNSKLAAKGNDQVQVFVLAAVDEDKMDVRALTADGNVIDEWTIALKGVASGTQ